MLFAGRIRLHSAGAFWRFQKGGKVQEIMHQLKYKGRKELGNLAGRMYGAHLKKHPDFATIDAILPVPLAPKKLKKRGYNQSACFAEGLSMSMGRPHWNHSLERRTETDSQTNKTRFERWQNVSTVFGVREPQRLQGLHVLLVDDVVTTGATLEACAQELLLIPGLKLSIVTMAYAQS